MKKIILFAAILVLCAATGSAQFVSLNPPTSTGTGVPGEGTVTSVAATVPSIMSIGGSPITGAGTLAFSLKTQAANKFLAGPSTGADATPTFRVFADADFPTTLNLSIKSLAITPTTDAPALAARRYETGTADIVQFQQGDNTVLSYIAHDGVFHGAVTGNASTATALAANPADCGANTFANTIAANGDLTCGAVAQAAVTNLTTDLAAKAPLASPALTGDPTAPTAGGGDNDTSIATTAFVTAAVAAGGGGSAPFSDATAIVKNSSDATKLFKIDAAGITTGNTVTAAPPIATGSFTFARQDAAQTFTGDQTFSGAIKQATNATMNFYTGGGTGSETANWNSSAGATFVQDTYSSATTSPYRTYFTGFYAGKPADSIRNVSYNSQWQRGELTELITLSTSGTTTDSSADLLPANSLIKGVACRVTTTITTATNWAVGDGTTAARFISANSTLTAGTTAVGLNHMQGSVSTDAAGPVQPSAAKLRITTTGTPGAGAIRCTVFYETFIPPTS